MLSYQHKYHAGNHADVFKHLALIALLSKFNRKSKPYFYLDTHAGAGQYALSSQGEHQDTYAFTQLSFEHASEVLQGYKAIIEQYKNANKYPGSPALAISMAREQDKFHFNELASEIYRELKYFVHRAGSTHQRNGFEVLKGLMPPKPNRGMVLIDPPYENADEYDEVSNAVEDALKKWPNGTFAIWYPVLSSTRVNRKTKALEKTPKAGLAEKMLLNLSQRLEQPILVAQFGFCNEDSNIGMYASGLCIVNPPYELDETLNTILMILDSEVSENGAKGSRVYWLNEPK
ncbi:23S rRNA (adenine(2030)-N(6))-methyltransferase RlmJ [Agaribacter flavus]|uniref:Ribosomal RNA large subunit methyltransferase J n=1 Tax=Agaribacter flavus TaxID=1902781 RepID=A0ABV7FN85_9ALTE